MAVHFGSLGRNSRGLILKTKSKNFIIEQLKFYEKSKTLERVFFLFLITKTIFKKWGNRNE